MLAPSVAARPGRLVQQGLLSQLRLGAAWARGYLQ